MELNPNCNGGKCIVSIGEVRVLPHSNDSHHGNDILCNHCFLEEIYYRKNSGNYSNITVPRWEDIKIYDSGIPLPIVYKGGTSLESLVNLRLDCLSALRDAKHALTEMNPHPRDYLFKSGSYELALAHHLKRVKKIDEILEEITQEAIKIQDLYDK
jgi:hypothetical protein